MTTDRNRWAEEAGAEVETLVGGDLTLIHEAWHQIKGCYKAVVDHAPPPARVILERITAERVELYSYLPPPGKNIPISVLPFPVDDLFPTEDKIKWSIKRLRNKRSGGAPGMRAQYLKWWLVMEGKAEKYMETTGKEEATTTAEGARTGISAAQQEKIWTTGRGSWILSSPRSGRGSLRRKQRGRRWSLFPRGRRTTGALVLWR